MLTDQQIKPKVSEGRNDYMCSMFWGLCHEDWDLTYLNKSSSHIVVKMKIWAGWVKERIWGKELEKEFEQLFRIAFLKREKEKWSSCKAQEVFEICVGIVGVFTTWDTIACLYPGRNEPLQKRNSWGSIPPPDAMPWVDTIPIHDFSPVNKFSATKINFYPREEL